jgi:hypothetical protein
MTRALQGITEGRASFVRAVERFGELEKDLETRILNQKRKLDEDEVAKKKENAEMQVEYERERKRRRVDLEHELRANETGELVRLLESQGKTAVPADHLARMERENKELRESREVVVEAAVGKIRLDMQKSLEAQEERLGLQHAAELATTKATVVQHKDTIELLNRTIANLRQDIDNQRELTKQVALAHRPRSPAPSHHQQHPPQR